MSERQPTPCRRCGTDDILDDATGLCLTCHVALHLAGPVQPLYLNLEEARTLAVAVELLLKLTDDMTAPDVKDLAEVVIAFRDGPAGSARLDQVLAAATARRPILHSLRTALAELGYDLERHERLEEGP